MDFKSGTVLTTAFPAIDTELTGKHVYRLLESKGYSAKQASCLLGFEEPQAVYNWKYGKRMPSIDNLDKISRLLNISINDLLVHTDDGEAIVFALKNLIFFNNFPDQTVLQALLSTAKIKISCGLFRVISAFADKPRYKVFLLKKPLIADSSRKKVFYKLCNLQASVNVLLSER